VGTCRIAAWIIRSTFALFVPWGTSTMISMAGFCCEPFGLFLVAIPTPVRGYYTQAFREKQLENTAEPE
jgi:hypothetical protein